MGGKTQREKPSVVGLKNKKKKKKRTLMKGGEGRWFSEKQEKGRGLMV